MEGFDIINANCKQCGEYVEFISRGIAPSRAIYDIEEDIPYDVIDNADRRIKVCHNCGAYLRFKSSVSAWIEIAQDETGIKPR